MKDFIDKLWEELNGYNMSTIYFFHVDDRILTYDFTPTYSQKPYTLAWITFNFNINKVVETLKSALNLKNTTHSYYIMCDNAFVLLITAFESYLASTYNNIRSDLGKETINPKNLYFQKPDKLKEKYKEINIDIAHLDEKLWTKLFSTSNQARGLIELRNIIVHNGWKTFKNKSDMLNHILVKESIITVVNFIKILEDVVIKDYPNLNNLKRIKGNN